MLARAMTSSSEVGRNGEGATSTAFHNVRAAASSPRAFSSTAITLKTPARASTPLVSSTSACTTSAP